MKNQYLQLGFRLLALFQGKAKLVLTILPILVALLGASTARAATTTVTFNTAGTTTWTAPAGVTAITIEAWGGGGGGGQDAAAAVNGGGGGGGGAYAKVNSFAVTPGNSYSYTVGAGGTSANPGVTTTFNSTTCVAAGGSAGVNGPTGTGGAGGTTAASTGDVKFAGGSGFTSASAIGGGGGSSAGTGSGGNAATSNTGASAVTGGGPGGAAGTAGAAGSPPASGPGGGGGGGSANSGTTRLGGAGFAGQIKITYVTPTVVTLTSSGNWTAPAGVTTITVEVWGGGGRGGSRTTAGEGGGGGGGAYSLGNATVSSGSGYSVVVGAGSTSGTSPGGDSHFIDSSTIMAKGGGSVADDATGGAVGGAAGSGVGTVKFSGGNGATAASNNTGGGGSSAGTSSNGNNASGATGGSAPTGGGAGGNGAPSNNQIGINGTVPGGGGGGGDKQGAGTYAGGNGAAGKVVISYNPRPTAVVSGSATICSGGSTTISAALTGTGPWNVTWSDGPVQSAVASSPATRNVSPSSTITYTVTSLTDANNTAQPGDLTGSAVVTVDQPPTTANAGPAQAQCETATATLAGNTPTVGTGTWTVIAGSGTVTTPSSPTSGVTGLSYGANTFRWTIANGACTSSTSDVTITRSQTPTTANAGPAQAQCETATATLAGNTPTVGTGTWTVIAGSGTVTTPSSPTSGVTGLSYGANTFRWTIANGACTSSTSDVTITRSQTPTTANAGPAQAQCETATATLAGNTPTVGTGTWTVIAGSGTVTTPSSPTSGVTGLSYGANTFRWTIANGACTSSTSDVTITRNPTSVGGTAAANTSPICSGSSSSVTVSGYTGTIQWQQSPDGSSGWVNVTGGSGATTATYATPALTVTTYYKAVLTSGTCPSADSTVATVVVDSTDYLSLGTITATEVQPYVGTIDVKGTGVACGLTAVQGTVKFSVEASLDGGSPCTLVVPPTVALLNGANSANATYVNESPIGFYNFEWVVGASTANGTWTVTVTAADTGTSTEQSIFKICVNKAQATGNVQLQGFLGTTRVVTFVATDSTGAGGTLLKTWNLPITTFSGANSTYTLTDVPAGTLSICAKTAWNLQKRILASLNGQLQATGRDFILPGGDLNGDNQVSTSDYAKLRTGWGSNPITSPPADINGDGTVDNVDYLILQGNWHTAGDPQ